MSDSGIDSEADAGDGGYWGGFRDTHQDIDARLRFSNKHVEEEGEDQDEGAEEHEREVEGDEKGGEGGWALDEEDMMEEDAEKAPLKNVSIHFPQESDKECKGSNPIPFFRYPPSNLLHLSEWGPMEPAGTTSCLSLICPENWEWDLVSACSSML